MRITASSSNTSYQLRFILSNLNTRSDPAARLYGSVHHRNTGSWRLRAHSAAPTGTSRERERGPQRWGGRTAVEQHRSAAPRPARLRPQGLRPQPLAGSSQQPPAYPLPATAPPGAARPPSAPRPPPGLTAPLSPSPTPRGSRARPKPSCTALPDCRGRAPVLPAPPHPSPAASPPSPAPHWQCLGPPPGVTRSAPHTASQSDGPEGGLLPSADQSTVLSSKVGGTQRAQGSVALIQVRLRCRSSAGAAPSPPPVSFVYIEISREPPRRSLARGWRRGRGWRVTCRAAHWREGAVFTFPRGGLWGGASLASPALRATCWGARAARGTWGAAGTVWLSGSKYLSGREPPCCLKLRW